MMGVPKKRAKRPSAHGFRAIAREPRAWVLGAILAALVCLPAAAQAEEKVSVKLGFSPYKLGASTTIVTSAVVTTTNGEVPSPATKLELRFPTSLSLASSNLGLAICTPELLLKAGERGCSPNSRMGIGGATMAVPFGPEIVRENANINIFMGPPVGETTTLLFYAEGRTPVFAQVLLEGGLTGDSGPFNELLLKSNVPVVPTLPGARDVSITEMRLSLGPRSLYYYETVRGRTVRFRPRGLVLPAKCPKGGFSFPSAITFLDGTVVPSTPVVSCPHRGRHG